MKARLSEYVSRAADGDHIVVTVRGKPVALLIGLGGASMLDRGIDEGWITPPRRRARLEPVTGWTASRSTADVLDEDRG